MGQQFPTAGLKTDQRVMACKSSTDLCRKSLGGFPETEDTGEKETTFNAI